MKKILLIPFLFLGGCSLLQKPADKGPSQDYIFKDSGLIQGTTSTDFDSLHDVSFTDTTQFEIHVGNVLLNKYEYSVSKNTLTFGKEVTIMGALITYKSPAVPVAPKGSSYIIQWSH